MQGRNLYSARNWAGELVLSLAICAPKVCLPAEPPGEDRTGNPPATDHLAKNRQSGNSDILNSLIPPRPEAIALAAPAKPDNPEAIIDRDKSPFWPTLMSSLLAVAGYTLYWRQIRQRETPRSLSSTIVYTANDASLVVAALLTPNQGKLTPMVYSVFAAFGALICLEILKDSDFSSCRTMRDRLAMVWKGFKPYEKKCSIAAVFGISAMLASKIPSVATYVSEPAIALFGTVIGLAVNAIAAVPLIREMLTEAAEVGQNKKEGDSPSFIKRFIKAAPPVIPFVLNTSSIPVSIMGTYEQSWITLLSPLGIGLTNLALVGTMAYSSWRKSSKPST